MIFSDEELLSIIDMKMLELDSSKDDEAAEIIFLMNCKANIFEKQTLKSDIAKLEAMKQWFEASKENNKNNYHW